MPWDNDLDFFVHADDVRSIEKLKLRLFMIGCRLHKRRFRKKTDFCDAGDCRIFKIKTLRKFDGHALTFDLIVKHPFEGHFYWEVGKVQKRVPRGFYDTFDTIDYQGRTYSTPKNTDDYLVERYGDWLITRKEYDYKTDDNAILR